MSVKKAKTATRDISLDFTKGILVIFMVLYHSLNYLDYGTIPHDYMSFLPPSFILITGFIVCHFYLPNYRLSRGVINLRLAVRGLKILTIFTILNISARLILTHNQYGVSLDLKTFLDNWFLIYFLGSPKEVAFDILLPIGYTLFIAIVMLRFQSTKAYFVFTLAVFTIFLCLGMEYFEFSFYNLNLVSYGIIGMAIGLVRKEKLDKFSMSWTALIFCIILYTTCNLMIKDSYQRQMLLTIIGLFIIYSAGRKLPLNATIIKQIILLGQYSLLCYIIQIFYIQLNSIASNAIGLEMSSVAFLSATVLIFTWLSAFLANSAIKFNRIINTLYRAVFS